MFSEDQLEQLRSFPEISRDELIRYFTPAAGDVAFVDPGRGRGAPDRLGMLGQLCTLPWLGFVPDGVRLGGPAGGWPGRGPGGTAGVGAARAAPFGSSGEDRGVPGLEARPGWRRGDEG